MAKVIQHTGAEPPTKRELARQHCEAKGFQVLELDSKSITLQCPNQHAPFTQKYPTMCRWASGTRTVSCDACSIVLRHGDRYIREMRRSRPAFSHTRGQVYKRAHH